MKTYFAFNLNTEQDRETHKTMLGAANAKMAIQEWLKESLRRRIKYGELSKEMTDLLVEIRTELYTSLKEYDAEGWLE